MKSLFKKHLPIRHAFLKVVPERPVFRFLSLHKSATNLIFLCHQVFILPSSFLQAFTQNPRNHSDCVTAAVFPFKMFSTSGSVNACMCDFCKRASINPSPQTPTHKHTNTHASVYLQHTSSLHRT